MAGLPTSPSTAGALKEMPGDSLLIGAALNLDQIEGRDSAALEIVKRPKPALDAVLQVLRKEPRVPGDSMTNTFPARACIHLMQTYLTRS